MIMIKCLCEECRYNEDHKCSANNIEVKSSGDNKVCSADGTCCNTFESKADSFSSRA